MIKIDKKYLPSKKFLIALSIAIIVIIIAIILSYWKPNITKYKNNNLTVASSSKMSIDTDDDGLQDWKENLYGTDLKKTDTDDDGTSDLEEIIQNRDPLKANTALIEQEPNDKLELAIIEKNQKAIEEYKKLNETEKFSRNLMSNIFASQPLSGQMDQNTTNKILEKAISEIPEKNYEGITKISDLNLQKTDNFNLNKNITEYVSSFTKETNKLVPLLGTNIILINSYVSDGSIKNKTEMLKLINKYQLIVDNLKKIPIPVTSYYDVNYHLIVINNLEKIMAIDRDIVNSDKDSLGIFSNLSIYNNVIDNLFSTLIKIDEILKIKR